MHKTFRVPYMTSEPFLCYNKEKIRKDPAGYAGKRD